MVKVSCVLELISKSGAAPAAVGHENAKVRGIDVITVAPDVSRDQSFAHLLQRVPDNRSPLDITVHLCFYQSQHGRSVVPVY